MHETFENISNPKNIKILEQFYDSFLNTLKTGSDSSLFTNCSEKVTFQVMGKSKLAGKFDRSNFQKSFISQLKELSSGTFKMEIHDIMASDRHGMVLSTNTLERDGKKLEYRSVQVWRIENGILLAFYEYPRDLYQFDAIWG